MANQRRRRSVAGGDADDDLLVPWRWSSNPSVSRKNETLRSTLTWFLGEGWLVATQMVGGSGELYLTVVLGNKDRGEREIYFAFVFSS